MKILIVTQYFYPENLRINDLVFSLKKRGHTIEVLTGKPNYPKENILKVIHGVVQKKNLFKG